MDELIKIKDIGYSDEPEPDNDNAEIEEYEFSSEETEDGAFSFKTSITFGQILMFEFAICVLIVIAIAVMYYVKPDITKDFLHNCHIQIDSDFNYKQEIAEIISKLTTIINAQI